MNKKKLTRLDLKCFSVVFFSFMQHDFSFGSTATTHNFTCVSTSHVVYSVKCVFVYLCILAHLLCMVAIIFKAYCVYSFLHSLDHSARHQLPQTPRIYIYSTKEDEWPSFDVALCIVVNIQMCTCTMYMCVFVDFSRFSLLVFSLSASHTLLFKFVNYIYRKRRTEEWTQTKMAKGNRHLGIFLFYRSVYKNRTYDSKHFFPLGQKKRRKRKKWAK